MTPEAERRYLERVLGGKELSTLDQARTLGRLAELYLQAPTEHGHARAALMYVRAAMEKFGIAKDNPLYPKLCHYEAMAMRWQDYPAPADATTRGQAATIDREAWQDSLKRAPGEAILFASQWADWAWANGLFEEAGEAYENAHRALRPFLSRLLANESDRLNLLESTRFATRGAYALFAVGRIMDASVLLERACGLIFDINSQMRDILRLKEQQPGLGARLLAAIEGLEAHAQPAEAGFGLDSLGNLPAGAREAHASLEAIVREARALPGFSRLALPADEEDVKIAAFFAPQVYLVPTDKGTACWIICTTEGRLRSAVTLLPVTIPDILGASMPFLDAAFGGKGTDSGPPLDALLRWLGANVMKHVRAAVDRLGAGAAPPVLRPFGMLHYLPLHAALVDDADAAKRSCVFAPGTLTYGYSARGLAWSYYIGGKQPVDKALVINNPKPLPTLYNSLLLSDFECAVVSKLFPTEILADDQATSAAVTAALRGANLVHFCCHGDVEPRLDYAGVLLLAWGQELTYLHLRSIPALTARLVVLAACRSGTTGVSIETPLSLAASFLAANAAAVLGTLWQVDEMATLLLITRFYEEWGVPGKTPAAALGAAQVWLRDSSAECLREVAPAAALASPAGAQLRDARASTKLYSHPAYWGAFFLAGA